MYYCQIHTLRNVWKTTAATSRTRSWPQYKPHSHQRFPGFVLKHKTQPNFVFEVNEICKGWKHSPCLHSIIRGLICGNNTIGGFVILTNLFRVINQRVSTAYNYAPRRCEQTLEIPPRDKPNSPRPTSCSPVTKRKRERGQEENNGPRAACCNIGGVNLLWIKLAQPSRPLSSRRSLSLTFCPSRTTQHSRRLWWLVRGFLSG